MSTIGESKRKKSIWRSLRGSRTIHPRQFDHKRGQPILERGSTYIHTYDRLGFVSTLFIDCWLTGSENLKPNKAQAQSARAPRAKSWREMCRRRRYAFLLIAFGVPIKDTDQHDADWHHPVRLAWTTLRHLRRLLEIHFILYLIYYNSIFIQQRNIKA